MAKGGLFTIGEFSNVTGIGIHSLRYYDDIGALKPEYVDPVSNYRYYSFSQLSRIPAINICRDAGINLGEFGRYIDAESIDYSRLLEEGRESLEQKITEFRSRQRMLDQMEQLVKARKAVEEGHDVTLQADGIYIWTVPYSKREISGRSSDILLRVSADARDHGHGIDPVCYGLIERMADGEPEIRAFSVVSAPDDSLISIPQAFPVSAGSCLLTRCDESSLESAREAVAGCLGQHTDGSVIALCIIGGDAGQPLCCAASLQS